MESTAVYHNPSVSIISYTNGILDKKLSTESFSEEKNWSDRIDLSPEGKELSARLSLHQTDRNQENQKNSDSPNTKELTAEEITAINKLQARDAEVRAHELAHLSTAGQYAAGGASFTYQVGPNGKKYAVGGEVPIDIGKESTPQETITKMEKVKRAALAPAKPSSADLRIAAQASVTQAQAKREINSQAAINGTSNSSLPSSEGDGENHETKKNEYGSSTQKHPAVDASISHNSRQMILKAYRMNLMEAS